MPQCSLLVLRGDDRAKAPQQFEFAKLAGVKFIELRHRRITGNGPASASRGFQGVEVFVSESGSGERKFRAQYSQRDGQPCRSLRPLVFEPEGPGMVLTAWLPDTEYNRHKLALQYFDAENQWVIQDPSTLASIKQEATRIRDSKPQEPTEREVMLAQSKEIGALRDKLLMQERELEEAKKQAAVIQKARRKITELSSAHEDGIREILYNEEAEVVEKLKEKHGEKWEESDDFRRILQPKIEKRVQEELERMNATADAGVGV